MSASAGRKACWASGARFVYFQSSNAVVGNPTALKRVAARPRSAAMASLPSRRPASGRWSMADVMASAAGRGLEGAVAFFLELAGQALVAGLHDAPLRQHMDEVGHQIVQQPLVVGNGHHG